MVQMHGRLGAGMGHRPCSRISKPRTILNKSHPKTDDYMDVRGRKRREQVFETRMTIQESRPDPDCSFETSLNDNVYYVDLIHQIFGDKAEGSWEKSAFENSLKEWADEKEYRHTSLSKLISGAGSAEIASLIIAKGLENDLLKKKSQKPKISV